MICLKINKVRAIMYIKEIHHVAIICYDYYLVVDELDVGIFEYLLDKILYKITDEIEE